MWQAYLSGVGTGLFLGICGAAWLLVWLTHNDHVQHHRELDERMAHLEAVRIRMLRRRAERIVREHLHGLPSTRPSSN